MMLKQKFQYLPLKRIQTPEGRMYTADGHDPVPSVTTVLDKTSDKTALLEWRKRVGEAEAQRISTESANLGTRVHTAMEKYIGGEPWDSFGSNLIHQQAKKMSMSMIRNGLDRVDEVWGLETGLICDGLYAGTADCIGLYDQRPTIIDFKTAKKIKKKEWITDYFLQGVFYAEAHNSMYKTDISQVAILMVDREANFQNFVIKDSEYEYYRDIAMQRLAKYYNVDIPISGNA